MLHVVYCCMCACCTRLCLLADHPLSTCWAAGSPATAHLHTVTPEAHQECLMPVALLLLCVRLHLFLLLVFARTHRVGELQHVRCAHRASLPSKKGLTSACLRPSLTRVAQVSPLMYMPPQVTKHDQNDSMTWPLFVLIYATNGRRLVQLNADILWTMFLVNTTLRECSSRIAAIHASNKHCVSTKQVQAIHD